jgi:hypothetical protein
MDLYTRRQLLLLVVGLGGAGVGMGVGQWRRANPDVIDALEHLDRAAAPAPRVSAPRPSARPRSEARGGAPCEPRRARRAPLPDETLPAPLSAEPVAGTLPVEAISLTEAW